MLNFGFKFLEDLAVVHRGMVACNLDPRRVELIAILAWDGLDRHFYSWVFPCSPFFQRLIASVEEVGWFESEL